MKYCQQCAADLHYRIPEGDDKPRYCCIECDLVFYQNPKNVVGTLPIFDGKVLLCKRAIQPRKGKWTLPAGFLENGESSLEGAIRETDEEAGASVKVSANSLYTLFNLPSINQMYLFFKVELENLDFEPGIESLEVQLFAEEEIPWKEIAFPVVKTTLESYFEDRKNNVFPVRMFDVHHSADKVISTTLISENKV
ncbi:MAG: NUDIX hydrolase [Gammaproteobacteria bacterium]|jgi:ADP-ribose pyrophosphatase YjhB (NUDIX family)|nr:NUDIX hydrolase [Gammaproteobacteria bacterium]MBT3859147.1 NUDIX hydrolase [Gammaproteobacteria bacterium]MBT3987147.1 NUDIX hydrolase [Gammaproteobacteria bacterium]MBT4255112.1 NUDIX hydrolase [Gammaproteobacteria bacterium]MBT4580566.1 NUDIX hydrolase [Gammaproteobacteria bacterium]